MADVAAASGIGVIGAPPCDGMAMEVGTSDSVGEVDGGALRRRADGVTDFAEIAQKRRRVAPLRPPRAAYPADVVRQLAPPQVEKVEEGTASDVLIQGSQPLDVHSRRRGAIDKFTCNILAGRLKGFGTEDCKWVMDFSRDSLATALRRLAEEQCGGAPEAADLLVMPSSPFVELLALQRLRQIKEDDATALGAASTAAVPLDAARALLCEAAAAEGELAGARDALPAEGTSMTRGGDDDQGSGGTPEGVGAHPSQVSATTAATVKQTIDEPEDDPDVLLPIDANGEGTPRADGSLMVHLGLKVAPRCGSTPPAGTPPVTPVQSAAHAPASQLPKRLRPYGKIVILDPSASHDIPILLPVVELGRPAHPSPSRFDIAQYSSAPKQISRCHAVLVAEPAGMRVVPLGRNAIEVSVDNDIRMLSPNAAPLLVTQRAHITVGDVTMVLIPA
eukprot:TRINITY_DN439_c1_g2_i2.p1 TRINITY_DN439_c1_g2~~TRINITY_DN439_c1_g2_i2.p1  ORF type:complete len:448 (+),score=55.78 TRINITY_DN439_c1_g2_i2:64-1407(+)